MPPDAYRPEPLAGYVRRGEAEMIRRAREFHEEMRLRRSVRDFEARPVPRALIEQCILAAGTAPSGANQQPWHFAVVTDPGVRRRIREAAEREEREFYGGRAPKAWLEALAPLGTDPSKPFLEDAAALIVVFALKSGVQPDGRVVKHYYVPESVGIAAGFLVAALHHAGLATLTHTPSPMGFLNELCARPPNEKPVMVVVAGYPREGCTVPAAAGVKKPLSQVASWI